ncbi:DUF4162 domain-containing protein, partial [Guyparkeria sp. 1SP6A2]|nr:DUF4162 domain-containing protein [Guyparkeria sp. 1SP6A2]
KLSVETFILDIDDEQKVQPLSQVISQRMVDGSLEIELDKSQGLNAVFQQLTQQGVSVRSMRNKANRLEELFVTIVRDSNQGDN